ncbi:hypothetical protein [Pontiella sulfatireligans]|uniref:O-antigen ligase domain-containing protein n=1 Tax=Pontiella sulfatireligans TaxID=2750658 RepID=A0A6C2UDI8_9BACT|nr:hypothetical protein [Pontiella sulfatireligans]VGO18258.1 hypothetical protein SCARR_00310 [Pontiella sulfatireligans]
MHSQLTDSVKIKQGMLTALLIALTVYLFGFGLSKNMPAIGLLIPLIGIVSVLLSHPAHLLILLMFIQIGGFLVPGLPGALSLARLLLFMMIGWSALDVAIRQQKSIFSYQRDMDIWMWVFLLNIFLIMMVRGVGFRMMGGSTYGGGAYIGFIAAILFYFAVVRIRLTDKHVKMLLFAMLFASIIPMVAEVFVYFRPAQSWWITRFIHVGANYSLGQKFIKGGIERWGSFSKLAYALIPFAYVFCRKQKTRTVLILLAIVLVGLTGFRSRILRIGVLVFFTSMYYSKSRMKTFVMWGMIGFAGLAVLMVTAPLLPASIQRSISFIPFLPVDADIALKATGTSTWRFDMWRDYCIPNVPKYLLVGRGFAHDIAGFAWLDESWYGTGEFYYFMGRYHSGPFSLLLDYGLLGTISFSLFFVLVVRDGWQTVRRYAMNQDNLAARYYVFLTILMTYNLLSFYLIFGDVDSQILEFLLIAAQMRILKKNFLESSVEPGDSEISIPGNGESEVELSQVIK